MNPNVITTLVTTTTFADDSSAYEKKYVVEPGHMLCAFNYVEHLSAENDKNVNQYKTKFLKIMFGKSDQDCPLSVPYQIISHIKYVGLHISKDINCWYIITVLPPRIDRDYGILQLEKAGIR